MNLWAIAFTRKGALLCDKLIGGLNAQGHQGQGFCKGGYGFPPLTEVEESLSAWTGRAFAKADGIVFVGACGIAVRAIAPYVKSKTIDPAVVVIDELGRFSVSLLSGHMGGANDLAKTVAEIAGATPVISTATDCNGLFSVDSFAVKHDLAIGSMAAAKAVSAALLDGKPVLLQCDDGLRDCFPKELPAGISLGDQGPLGICVSLDGTRKPFDITLNLIPRRVVLGIGCRKDTPEEAIQSAVNQALESHGISLESIQKVCSIDLKQKEPGLLAFCHTNKLPFQVYSAQELSEATGDFTPSGFVKGVTGVDNVCERAAVLGSTVQCSNGKLLVKKTIYPQVTIAIAIAKAI